MDTILKNSSFIFNYGYKIYCSPFKWNKSTRRVAVVDEKWRRAAGLFSLAVSMITVCGQIGLQITGRPPPTKSAEKYFQRFLQILASILGTVCQANTLTKVHEMCEVINAFVLHYDRFEKEGRLPFLPRIAKQIQSILWVAIGMAHLMPGWIIGLGLSEYRPDISRIIFKFGMGPAIYGRREGWNVFLVLTITLIEVIIFSHQLWFIVMYGALFLFGGLIHTKLVKQQRDAAKNRSLSTSTLKQMDDWLWMYKWLFIGARLFNNIVRDYLLPCGLLGLICIQVAINVIVIASPVQTWIKVLATLINIVLEVFLILVGNAASFIGVDCEAGIRAMKNGSLGIVTNYDKRRLNSCMPARIYFGPFYHITETFVLDVNRLVLETTINALLTFT